MATHSPQRPRVAIHWFRRDLRLEDNAGLARALDDGGPVLPLFIFDRDILGRLADRADRRVDFIHRAVTALKTALEARGGTLLVEHGRPLEVWFRLLRRFEITSVTVNHDHEPLGIARDREVAELLAAHRVPFHGCKDHSIFERGEIVKADGAPYSVFTPYARRWRERLGPADLRPHPSLRRLDRLWRTRPTPLPSLAEVGFEPTDLQVPPARLPDRVLRDYPRLRDRPAADGTSRLGVHLRFGTVSPRRLVARAREASDTFLGELIWREFFMQVLWHFPHVTARAFKPAYDAIHWRDDPRGFEAWCEGRTGFPLVDAGMRELRATGFMPNRVRMVAASILARHLLIDWRRGESWFARWLLDFELSSNNGNWQWASGSGCDAAPYFRIFNPDRQLERFDPELEYVRRWVPEHGTPDYPAPIVEHVAARERALAAYRAALQGRRE